MNRLQVVFLVLLLAFVTLMWLGTGRVPAPSMVESVPSVVQPTAQTVSQPAEVQPAEPVAQPSTSPFEPTSPLPVDPSFVGQVHLTIPVAGIRPDQLLDTFTDSRSEGRTHDAIDIMAPAETPVVAAADGQIQKLFQSERGGITIYQLSADRKLLFYYAHLARYADGLTEGKQVRRGEVIAYVGDTGNAGPGNYHLHFSIAMVSDPKRYWEGTNINPYPLLRGE
ncbi:MAG: M23 family metallopeptidase [Pyrinomonadaceae bacterium]